MLLENDWRLRGQEEYMKGIKFNYIKFISEKCNGMHTHCEFCWHKFMEHPEKQEDCSSKGYCSVDGKFWVCKECFADFKQSFSWSSE